MWLEDKGGGMQVGIRKENCLKSSLSSVKTIHPNSNPHQLKRNITEKLSSLADGATFEMLNNSLRR